MEQNNYIRARCVTNLDDLKGEDWPNLFCSVPNIGDRVRAKSGKSLKVIGITHCSSSDNHTHDTSPYIIIELYNR